MQIPTSDTFGTLSRGLRGAYAQINPWDANRTWDTVQKGIAPGYRQKPVQITPTPSYEPGNYRPVDTSAFDAQNKTLSEQIKALQSQLATQPKLPFYDTSKGWAKAQASAQNVVDPVYVDKLNQYLQKSQLNRAQTEAQTNLAKQDIQTGLTQGLQDINTQRERTTEDVATQLGDVTQQEGNFQTNEGTQFDRARQALLGNTAQSGLATSGLGQQQNQQSINDRNIGSGQQTQQFTNQRRDINQLRDRTFADLSTGEGRAKSGAEFKTKQQDTNLKDFIDNANLEEKAFRTQNESERLSAIAQNTQSEYNQGAARFISSLIGSGASPQDIALAQQVYGGGR